MFNMDEPQKQGGESKAVMIPNMSRLKQEKRNRMVRRDTYLAGGNYKGKPGSVYTKLGHWSSLGSKAGDETGEGGQRDSYGLDDVL